MVQKKAVELDHSFQAHPCPSVSIRGPKKHPWPRTTSVAPHLREPRRPQTPDPTTTAPKNPQISPGSGHLPHCVPAVFTGRSKLNTGPHPLTALTTGQLTARSRHGRTTHHDRKNPRTASTAPNSDTDTGRARRHRHTPRQCRRTVGDVPHNLVRPLPRGTKGRRRSANRHVVPRLPQRRRHAPLGRNTR